MIIKSARKPSQDPVQEKLRQEKAVWNKDVSAFVNDLIHLKKMMNGWPSKFHMEKSRIIDPIPADPATIIGALAGDFQDLSQRGNKIVQQQLDYSKNRKQKKPQVSPNQLSLPLVASHNYDLISNGSNILSRFFARIFNPAIGMSDAAMLRKYRMSLLTSALNTWKNFEKLQEFVVESSPESIFNSSKILNKIEDQWSFFEQGIATFNVAPNKDSLEQKSKEMIDSTKNVKKENIQEKSKNIESVDSLPVEPVSFEVELAEKAVIDFRFNITNFLDLDSKSLNSLVLKFSNASASLKEELAPAILIAYGELIKEANSKNNTSGKSLKEIFELKNQKVASYQMKVLAQKFITKHLGKLKHQISPFDTTSAFRLDIYKLSENCRKDINSIMDILEKGYDHENVVKYFTNVRDNINKIKGLMIALESTVKGKNFDQSFMNLLDQKNILEHKPNLNSKQKERLQKLIEQKNLRDLTNIYMKK